MKYPNTKLLTFANAKTSKGETKNWLTGILYLAPASLSGFNVCSNSTAGCRAACLNTAGMGKFSNVQAARIRKTQMLFNQRDDFILQLSKDIDNAYRFAKLNNMKLAIRLNGTSDIPWETPNFGMFPQRYPEIQFYDYTKSTKRMAKTLPSNYHLTFSASEVTTDNEIITIIKQAKRNVAVVFDKVPSTYLGITVVDGDEDDLRFLNTSGLIIGLKMKGSAKNDVQGFVRRVQ